MRPEEGRWEKGNGRRKPGGRPLRAQARRSGVAVGYADLLHSGVVLLEDLDDAGRARADRGELVPEALGVLDHLVPLLGRDGGQLHLLAVHAQIGLAAPVPHLAIVVRVVAAHEEERSEEHTSELQSIMPITYAGFCLQNKKKT